MSLLTTGVLAASDGAPAPYHADAVQTGGAYLSTAQDVTSAERRATGELKAGSPPRIKGKQMEASEFSLVATDSARVTEPCR